MKPYIETPRECATSIYDDRRFNFLTPQQKADVEFFDRLTIEEKQKLLALIIRDCKDPARRWEFIGETIFTDDLPDNLAVFAYESATSSIQAHITMRGMALATHMLVGAIRYAREEINRLFEVVDMGYREELAA